ncbi:unnamed protein product, partial [Laminaria digitata]
MVRVWVVLGPRHEARFHCYHHRGGGGGHQTPGIGYQPQEEVCFGQEAFVCYGQAYPGARRGWGGGRIGRHFWRGGRRRVLARAPRRGWTNRTRLFYGKVHYMNQTHISESNPYGTRFFIGKQQAVYYFNTASGVSQWEQPLWLDEVDPVTGAVYYVHSVSGEPQWEKPSEFVTIVRENPYATTPE